MSTDATADTVAAWVAQVVSLTRSYETLTPTAMNIAVELLHSIVKSSATLKLPSDVVVGVLGACDALAQAVLFNNPTASSHSVGPVVQDLMGLMEQFSSLALGQMNAMQYDSTLTSYQTFKSIAAVKSVVTSGSSSSSSSSVTVNIPPTATESLANTAQASVALTNIASGVTNVKIGLVETKAHLFNVTQSPQSRRRLSTSNLWQSSESVTSNLVKVVLPDVTVCGDASTSACAVTVTLPTVTTETYVDGAASASVFTTTCSIGSTKTVTNTCPDGTVLTTVCTGGSVAYTYTQTCPWLVVAPTCGRIVADSSSTLDVATDVCTVVSFTTASITCSCTVPKTTLVSDFTSSASVARRLTSADDDGVSGSGSVQLASVTTTNRLTAAAVTVYLSAAPSYRPTPAPSTATPTYEPTRIPTAYPTFEPTYAPTGVPTPLPSPTPTEVGWLSPSIAPSTLTPTAEPSFKPTYEPTFEPSRKPTELPTPKPTAEPSTAKPSPSPTTHVRPFPLPFSFFCFFFFFFFFFYTCVCILFDILTLITHSLTQSLSHSIIFSNRPHDQQSGLSLCVKPSWV